MGTKPTKVMTAAAGAFTYDDYAKQGWTDEQLLAQGLMEPVAENPDHDISTDNRLRLLIERRERLEEEKKGISDDIRDVMTEAKAVGYDTKIIGQIIKLRKMKPDARAEMEAVLDTYKNALGMA